MKRFFTLTVLSVEEAREFLVDHFTDFFVSNREHVARMLREGKYDDLPNLSKADVHQIVALLRENHLGEVIAQKFQSFCVAIECDDSMKSLLVVYSQESSGVSMQPPRWGWSMGNQQVPGQ